MNWGNGTQSGHHYKIDYWEVFNEPDLEHGFDPQTYTKLYDAVVEAIHKVSPETKFVGMSDSYAGGHPDFFMYFLNPRNHKPGIPLDMISYHFYAVPGADESPEVQPITYFYQADRFLEIVGYIEAIRKSVFTPDRHHGERNRHDAAGGLGPDEARLRLQADPAFLLESLRRELLPMFTPDWPRAGSMRSMSRERRRVPACGRPSPCTIGTQASPTRASGLSSSSTTTFGPETRL